MEKEGRTRLLRVLEILRARTDEGHTLSTAELERLDSISEEQPLEVAAYG